MMEGKGEELISRRMIERFEQIKEENMRLTHELEKARVSRGATEDYIVFLLFVIGFIMYYNLKIVFNF